jgi:hypothetical protein
VVISEQRERWLADGSPPVPTLVVDGTAHVLQHPSQAGALLGLETPPELLDARQIAWDIDAIAQAWLELVRRTPWPTLLVPVAGLGRTPTALAVDAGVGVRALAAAFAPGWFHWPGDPVSGETGDAAGAAYEASIVAGIGDHEALEAFVEATARIWRELVVDHEHEFEREPARPMRTPRGPIAWSALLEAQRLHAAQHYRQASSGTAAQGIEPPELELESLYGMRLPQALY